MRLGLWEFLHCSYRGIQVVLQLCPTQHGLCVLEPSILALWIAGWFVMGEGQTLSLRQTLYTTGLWMFNDSGQKCWGAPKLL